MNFLLSLIGSKLEVGTKIREAVNYQSSPGHLEPIATEVIFLLPGLSLEIQSGLLPAIHSALTFQVYCA